MARKKKSGDSGVSEGWMVTFSDLMTLLLTFFVLLLSMSSLTRNVLTEINTFMSPRNYLNDATAGRISDRMRLILQLLREPDVTQDETTLKDVLFPNDVLPDEMNNATLEDNLKVFRKPEGLVIVMTDALLFAKGSNRLTPAAKKILHSLVDVLHHTNADINISGFADEGDAASKKGLMELSGERAIAVLDYFLKSGGLPPQRFTISAYGADRPREEGFSAIAQSRNRRVEILLKNEQWLGRYRG